MSSDYLRANSDYWSQGVYDNENVESYVFRIYGRVLKHQFGFDGCNNEKVLEFGCGSGGAAKFFDSKGFDVFGVDQSPIDITRCQQRLPHISAQFKKIDPKPAKSDDWFGGKMFDIIVSFQTLYYLGNADLKIRLHSLNEMLAPGGIFIATMMHKSSWYFQMSSKATDGLRFVKFNRQQDDGREGLTYNDHYINFVEDESDLKKKFNIFKPVHTSGFYDGVYRDDQGSEKHLVFIGQKK